MINHTERLSAAPPGLIIGPVGLSLRLAQVFQGGLDSVSKPLQPQLGRKRRRPTAVTPLKSRSLGPSPNGSHNRPGRTASLSAAQNRSDYCGSLAGSLRFTLVYPPTFPFVGQTKALQKPFHPHTVSLADFAHLPFPPFPSVLLKSLPYSSSLC